MRTPFGADWDDLSLDHLIAFFAEPRNEGLRWEAKGGGIRRQHIREGVCGFANSTFGGFLVLGATQDQETKAWTVDHWEPPDEVELWVQNCVGNGGVDPAPSIDAKAWQLDGGGWLGCVLVYPVAVPPAVTSDGGVWVRTSGSTPQVKDAATLRDLIRRGEMAKERARQLSVEAAADLYGAPPEARRVAMVAAGAAPSIPAEASNLVFRESFWRGALIEHIRTRLAQYAAQGLQQFLRVHTAMDQGAVTVWNDDGFHGEIGFSVRVGRHGSVAVAYNDPEMESAIDFVRADDGDLRRLVTSVVDLIKALEGMGPIHLAMRFSDNQLGVVEVTRWIEVDGVDDALIESIIRELRRSKGHFEAEPEG
jgi:hypothetical protein